MSRRRSDLDMSKAARRSSRARMRWRQNLMASKSNYAVKGGKPASTKANGRVSL